MVVTGLSDIVSPVVKQYKSVEEIEDKMFSIIKDIVDQRNLMRDIQIVSSWKEDNEKVTNAKV